MTEDSFAPTYCPGKIKWTVCGGKVWCIEHRYTGQPLSTLGENVMKRITSEYALPKPTLSHYQQLLAIQQIVLQFRAFRWFHYLADVHTEIDIQKGEIHMAQQDWRVTFVNRRLTQDEKEHFKGWRDEYRDDLYDLLQALLNTQFKFSLSYVAVGDYYTASVTDKNEKSDCHNHCVSSRHVDVEAAILIALYKHNVLLTDGNWLIDKAELDWG